MTTIYTAIAILGMGAIIGLYMLTLILTDKRPPKAASFIHGLFALIGLVLLIYYSMDNDPGPVECVIIFLTAALVGLIVWWKDITGQKIPKWLAVTHGLTAVIGFTLLLMFAFM
jgi:hypothetical protein